MYWPSKARRSLHSSPPPPPPSGPPPQQYLVTVAQDLESHLFGNPHSQHGWSGNVGSAAAVAEARQLTLEMCHAPLGEYECVFTAGATGTAFIGTFTRDHTMCQHHNLAGTYKRS